MQKCSKCGSQVPNESLFCNHCGGKIEQPANPPPLPTTVASTEPQATGNLIARAKKYKSFYVYVILSTMLLLLGLLAEGLAGGITMLTAANFLWMFYTIIKPRSGTFGFFSSRIVAGLIFLAIFMVLMPIADKVRTPEQKMAQAAKLAKQPQTVSSIPISDLDKKKKENGALFDSTYAGKELVVSGKVEEMDFGYNKVKVSFKSADSFLHAEFPGEEAVYFRSVKSGDSITFKGTVKQSINIYNFVNSKLLDPIKGYSTMEFKPYDLFEFLYKEHKAATISNQVISINNAEIKRLDQSSDKTRRTITLILASGWRHPDTISGRLEIACNIKNSPAEIEKFYALKAGNNISIKGKFVYKDAIKHEITMSYNGNYLTECEIVK